MAMGVCSPQFLPVTGYGSGGIDNVLFLFKGFIFKYRESNRDNNVTCLAPIPSRNAGEFHI